MPNTEPLLWEAFFYVGVLLVFLLFLLLVGPYSYAEDLGRLKQWNKVYKGRCSYFTVNSTAALGSPNLLDKDLYCACRFDYRSLSAPLLRLGIKRKDIKRLINKSTVRVWRPENKEDFIEVTPVDWGPAVWTGRSIDLSKKALRLLGAETDEELCFCLNTPPELFAQLTSRKRIP